MAREAARSRFRGRQFFLAMTLLPTAALTATYLNVSRPPDLLHRATRLCAVPSGMMDFAPLSNDDLLVSISPGGALPYLGILRPKEPVRLITNHPAVQKWLAAIRSATFLSGGLSAASRKMVFSYPSGTFIADLSHVNNVARISTRYDKRYGFNSHWVDHDGAFWTEMDPASASHPKADRILVRSFSDNRAIRTLSFPKGAFADENHASRQMGEIAGGSCISVTPRGDEQAEGVTFFDVKVRRFAPGLPMTASYFYRLPDWVQGGWIREITPDGKRIVFYCRIEDHSPFHRLLLRLRQADPAPQVGLMACNLDGSNLVELGRTRERDPDASLDRLCVTPDGSAVLFDLEGQIWRLPL